MQQRGVSERLAKVVWARGVWCWWAVGLMLMASNSLAQPGNKAHYIPLQPAFVVNYGGEGRLRYLKAEVTLRVADPDAAAAVRYHMPYIRNNLVLLFSQQREEEIITQAGKEALRQAALTAVRELLETETGQQGIVDLYFESFIIQQ